jgi:hypothetical protein
MENDSPKTIAAREILRESDAIRSDRGAVYGHPWTNHLRISKLWSAYLDIPITPDQVAVCMALLKISRLAETPGHRGRDGYVDGCAYLALAAELSTTDPTEFDAY